MWFTRIVLVAGVLTAGCAAAPAAVVPSTPTRSSAPPPVAAPAPPGDTPSAKAPSAKAPSAKAPSAKAPSANAASREADSGTLVAIRAAAHSGYDRLVFEFAGTAPPPHRMAYVDEVRADPSDRLVPLAGHAFLRVVFDPARYAGRSRVTPNLPLLKEVAAAGQFEAVLSFGVGLDRVAATRVLTLTGPARLVIDFWYAPPTCDPEGHQPWRCAGSAGSAGS